MEAEPGTGKATVMESSAHTTGSVAPRDVVGRWMEEILSGERELHAVLEESFSQLAAAVQEWLQSREVYEATLREREARLARQQQELEGAIAQQRRLQEEALRLKAQVEARAAELDRRDRDLQARSSELDSRLAELGNAQGELRTLRELVEQLRGVVDSPPQAPSGGQTVSADELAHWQRRVQQLEKELAETQRQKESLETEVQVLRHRAMEWLEMLADQRRQLLEERTRWAAEIRQFRRLIELLLDRQMEPLPDIPEESEAPPPPRVIPYESLEARRTGTGDAFLDSLSAQFEQLRREFERRRGQESR